MNIVHNSRQLRNDRSVQAIGAMEEYLTHGPTEHDAPEDPVRCRLPECNNELFPCHRRTVLENWLFVPRGQDSFDARIVYQRDTGNRSSQPQR